MKFKKNLLTSALLLGLLSACSDSASENNNTNNENSNNTTTVAQRSQAQEVEERYRDLIEKTNRHLALDTNATFKEFKINLHNYNRGDDTSSAEGTINITLNKQEVPFIIEINDKIKHDKTLAEQGIVGEINSTLNFSQDTLRAHDIEDLFQTINPYLSLQTLIKTNDDIETNVKIAPISDDHLNYGGFSYQSQFKQKDYQNYLYPQKVEITSGQLNYQDEDSKILAKPFEIKGEFDGKNGEFKSTPINIDISKNYQNIALNIAEAILKLNNLKLNDQALVLGTQVIELKDIKITTNNDGIHLSKIELAQEISEHGDNYDFKTKFNAHFETNLLEKYAGIDALHIKNINIDTDLYKLSKESYRHFEELTNQIGEIEFSDAKNDIGRELIRLIETSTRLEGKLKSDTTQGTILFSYNFQGKEGTKISEGDKRAILEAFRNEDGKTLARLLLPHVDLSVHLSTPLNVIRALDLELPMMLYGSEFIEIKDDKVIVEIVIKDSKLSYKAATIDLRSILNL